MLTIRSDQQARITEATFLQAVVSAVRERPKELALPARISLPAVVAHGIAVARSYGLRSERDIVFFVLVMVTIGPRFHLEPLIHSILTDPSIPMERRAAALVQTIPEEVWQSSGGTEHDSEYWREALRADAEQRRGR